MTFPITIVDNFFEDPDAIISIDLSIPFPSKKGKYNCADTIPITPVIPRKMYFLYLKHILVIRFRTSNSFLCDKWDKLSPICNSCFAWAIRSAM